MPPSVNALHTVGAGYRNRKTQKWERVKTRSKDYTDWVEAAGREWRRQFPEGVPAPLTGRVRMVCAYVWPINGPGGALSDVDNRGKSLQDFLQGKFYDNDVQIDEPRPYKRIWGAKRPYAWVRVYEIKDCRYTDPRLIFEPENEIV